MYFNQDACGDHRRGAGPGRVARGRTRDRLQPGPPAGGRGKRCVHV